MRGLVALVLLAAACSAPSTSSLPQPSAGEASPPLASSSPTAPPPTRAAPPASAGAAPDAGVLYVFGADDVVYRCDGASGALVLVGAYLGVLSQPVAAKEYGPLTS